jgi:hypothetical protein
MKAPEIYISSGITTFAAAGCQQNVMPTSKQSPVADRLLPQASGSSTPYAQHAESIVIPNVRLRYGQG